MLVLSRQRRESIMVNGPEGGCLITVLEVRGTEVSLVISHAPANAPGDFAALTATLQLNAAVKVGKIAEVSLIDVRAEKARIGIVASRDCSVHRLEVWEAIQREIRHTPPPRDADDRSAGAPIQPPQGPKPPPLDVRLEEPPADDRGGA